MNIVVLMDSFKGSLSSISAGETVRDAILSFLPQANVFVKPVADGGEGTVDALLDLPGAQAVNVFVHDPLMRKHQAKYTWIPSRQFAVMEMSQACGLTLVASEKNIFSATTYGVGEMILDALDRGVTQFLIGIGGSATNDGGVGMLQALGIEFLDCHGKKIDQGAQGLCSIDRIHTKNLDPRIQNCTFEIACDVDNPLCGSRGASAVYGPQKGAQPKDIPILDEALAHYHQKTKEIFPSADDQKAGVGAAGGLGYGFFHYLKATLSPGIELILDKIGAEELIAAADLVITGEGKMDFQSSMGKTPIGVARLAKKYNKPVFAFCGVIGKDAQKVNEKGIDAFFPILDDIQSLEDAMKEQRAKENLTRTVTQVFRAIECFRR